MHALSRSPPPLDPDALDALFRARRDVRRFLTAPVPQATLDAVFASLESAPSVGLSQPWRIVMFDSPCAREAARRNFETANAAALAGRAGDEARLYARLKLGGLDQAPVQFAIFTDEACAKGKSLGREAMPEMLRYSVVCAILQLWLAAKARGLGLGWVSIIDPGVLSATAQAAPAWRAMGYFCLGWPETEETAPELERAGWERRGTRDDWTWSV